MIRLTRAQVREIDRRAIEEYHIPGIVLMENAASAVALHASSLMRHNANPAVVVVCGGGNNGGDGLATARKLHNFGWSVDLVVATQNDYVGDAGTNYRIVQSMKLPQTSMFDAADVINPDAVDLVIDALFGTGLIRSPRDEHRTLIEIMNNCALPILGVDLPSGMDCDAGDPLGACVKATKTVTFVAEKAGFANPASRQYTGEIVVGDIGCPRELIDQIAKMSPQ